MCFLNCVIFSKKESFNLLEVWLPLLWQLSWRKRWGKEVSLLLVFNKHWLDFPQLGWQPQSKPLVYSLQRLNLQTLLIGEHQVPGSLSNFSVSMLVCLASTHYPPPSSRYLGLPVLRHLKIMWGWFSAFPSLDLRFHFLRSDLSSTGPSTFYTWF